MAIPTPVNSQITDAVTQGNRRMLAEAPAMAAGALYETLAHSIGLLFENAVAAQQQQNALAQAAATQGVMQIYALDNTASAASAGATRAAFGDAADTLDVGARESLAQVGSSLAAQGSRLNAQVEDAVRLGNESVLAHAGDVAYAARSGADAMASALQTVGQALHEDLMRTLKLAATAACLQGMLRDPAKAAEYETVLATIGRLR